MNFKHTIRAIYAGKKNSTRTESDTQSTAKNKLNKRDNQLL